MVSLSDSVSQGKQLVGIFKEAKAAYRERKDALRGGRAGIQRAKTFDVRPSGPIYEEPEEDEEGFDLPVRERLAIRDNPDRDRDRHRAPDDVRSQATSHRSHRSRRPHRPRSDDGHGGGSTTKRKSEERARPSRALTEANLRTYTEVSATPPSAAPPKTKASSYRPPYAESAQTPRPGLVHSATMPLPARSEAPSTATSAQRRRSEGTIKKKKEIDMNLAYGDVPPDLASRVDLDPAHKEEEQDRQRGGAEDDDGEADDHDGTVTITAVGAGAACGADGGVDQETEARGLIDRIEDMLEQAHCVHHTASTMIANLQENPEAAAAVALTLAELSTLIGKMSPAFLGVLKGGSPAIFALLASPQFLIGTSIALGVTVIMFGGWKIIKRITTGGGGGRTLEKPFEMQPMAASAAGAADAPAAAAASTAAPDVSAYDDAQVLEEELSAIETWRRGIQPFGAADSDFEIPDIEPIIPESRNRYHDNDEDDGIDPDDSISRVGMMRPYRPPKSNSHRSRREREHRRERGGDDEKKEDRKKEDRDETRTSVSQRKSKSVVSSSTSASKSRSKKDHDKDKARDRRSDVTDSSRKHRDRERDDKDKDKEKEKENEKGKDKDKERDRRSEVAEGSKKHRDSKEREDKKDKDKDKDRDDRDDRDKRSDVSVRSHRSHRSLHSSASSRAAKRSSRVEVTPIEEADEEPREGGTEGGAPAKKEKKDNMIKNLFKKMKEKGDKERDSSRSTSVMV